MTHFDRIVGHGAAEDRSIFRTVRMSTGTRIVRADVRDHRKDQSPSVDRRALPRESNARIFADFNPSVGRAKVASW